MNEHPILFSTEMVKAILEGRKTQTRRVIKPQPDFSKYSAVMGIFADSPLYAIHWHEMPEIEKLVASSERMKQAYRKARCRFGIPGDHLWVKETWQIYHGREGINSVMYRADYPDFTEGKWRPSIFMPRWASRITLEVTGMRVERVQEISEEDAKAEGTTPSGVGADLERLKYRAGFMHLWDSINAKRGYGWDTNSYVWVVEFKLLHPHTGA